MLKTALVIAELIIALALIGSIVVQAKGTGLGSSFGGGGEFYRGRRGVEKIITLTTIVLSTLFGIISVLLLFIS